MSSEPPRNRLPFEPKKNRKPTESKEVTTPKSKAASAPKSTEKAPKGKAANSRKSATTASPEAAAIPEVVNRRMMKRMAIFSGTPTALGILSIVGSYFVVTREWFVLPNITTLVVSLGFFGLGVLGVSYGALSASWDEEDEGSKLGFREFKTNLGRMFQTWKSSKKEKQK